MSYLISSEDPVPNSPIIRANKRVFELSSFQIGERNFGKQKQRDSHVNQQILRKICGKIKQEENFKSELMESLELQKEFDKLKQNMRKRVKKLNVTNKMNSKNPIQTLSSLMLSNPQSIDLVRRHKNKIVLKMQSLNEAAQIVEQKRIYCKWYNRSRNSPTDSPIFNKVAHVLGKIMPKQTSQRLEFITKCTGPPLRRKKKTRGTHRLSNKEVKRSSSTRQSPLESFC